MKYEDVILLARSKMDEHGLLRWVLKFKKSKSVAGTCQRARWNLDPKLSGGVITLSKDFMEVFDEKEVMETILHEIAHALTPPGFSPHGKEWKAIARSIGSTGERCVPKTAPRPKGKYRGVCPNGHEYPAPVNRLTDSRKYRQSCPKCSNGYNPSYRFDWYEGTTLVHAQPKETLKASKIVIAPVGTPLHEMIKYSNVAANSASSDVRGQIALIKEVMEG